MFWPGLSNCVSHFKLFEGFLPRCLPFLCQFLSYLTELISTACLSLQLLFQGITSTRAFLSTSLGLNTQLWAAVAFLHTWLSAIYQVQNGVVQDRKEREKTKEEKRKEPNYSFILQTNICDIVTFSLKPNRYIFETQVSYLFTLVLSPAFLRALGNVSVPYCPAPNFARLCMSSQYLCEYPECLRGISLSFPTLSTALESRKPGMRRRHFSQLSILQPLVTKNLKCLEQFSLKRSDVPSLTGLYPVLLVKFHRKEQMGK